MKKIRIFMFMIVVCFLFSFSCTRINNSTPSMLNNDNDSGISVGFTNYELQPNDWIGLLCNESRINDGEELLIRVYLGTLNSYPDDYLKLFNYNDSLPTDVLVELVISYGECTKDLLQKGYYTYIEPEYVINYAITTEYVYKDIERFGNDE